MHRIDLSCLAGSISVASEPQVILVPRQLVAADRADAVDPEQPEDAALVERVRAGHGRELVRVLEVVEADGAVLLPRLAGPRRVQQRDRAGRRLHELHHLALARLEV